MVLGLDIGNTNIVVCLFNENNLHYVGRIVTSVDETVTYFIESLQKLFEETNYNLNVIEDAIISSVVPTINDEVVAALRTLFEVNALVIDKDTLTGLSVEGDYAQQLGIDVVVGCVAAMKRYPLPVVVVDMGTATTFAVVDKNKCYRGGAIVPGPRLFAEVLSNQTSQLPQISYDEPIVLLGQKTTERIRSGMINGNASLIDGMIARIERELDEQPVVAATGGYIPTILPYCKEKMQYDEFLILHGLSVIYYLNR